jgi:hypothetical protein
MPALSALRLLLFLLILTAIYSIGLAVLASHGYRPDQQTTVLLWSLEFPTSLAIWVRLDRRNRNLNLPFEFDAFVFFGWPLFLPYYLYRTRGKMGLIIMATVYTLYILPDLMLAIVSTIARLR